jgi:hypothetical protein
MQAAKDSFYLALRERLGDINPARTVLVEGATRPALLVVENEPATAVPPLANAFYLRWGRAEPAKGAERARRPLVKLECRFDYRTAGADASAVDRGRALAALDLELLQACSPHHTAKCDYEEDPAQELGSSVFWGLPEFGEVEVAHDELRRSARLFVFFFPEVDYS